MLSHATIPSQTYELSREEIFKILVALNENISPIRSVIRNAGEHVGAEFAHKVLSKESGLDCSLLYLQKALEELWESHCAPSRKEFLYDLYTLGALGRTLPGIDQRYPGLLANVAASVQGRQRYCTISSLPDFYSHLPETAYVVFRSTERFRLLHHQPCMKTNLCSFVDVVTHTRSHVFIAVVVTVGSTPYAITNRRKLETSHFLTFVTIALCKYHRVMKSHLILI